MFCHLPVIYPRPLLPAYSLNDWFRIRLCSSHHLDYTAYQRLAHIAGPLSRTSTQHYSNNGSTSRAGPHLLDVTTVSATLSSAGRPPPFPPPPLSLRRRQVVCVSLRRVTRRKTIHRPTYYWIRSQVFVINNYSANSRLNYFDWKC